MFRNIKLTILAALLALVSACAVDFSNPTVWSVSSSKDAGSVAACISKGWGSSVNNNNGIYTNPIANGYAVTFVVDQRVAYRADVTDSDNGSTTQFSAGAFTFQMQVNDYADVVKRCQL